MAEVYSDFALVYDTFMDETPYDMWCDFITGLIEEYGIPKRPDSQKALKKRSKEEKNLLVEQNTVLDLGCGTGSLTERMAAKGFDMIGIDNSEEMLQIAMEKRDKNSSNAMYILQDMRKFELFGTVGTVISVCDSINYLLEEADLLKTFRLVNNYLYPGGLFIFDFNTVYKYEEVIGDTTIAENREQCSFIWDNYYHAVEQINEYDLTIFVEEEPDLFRRYEETHYQRGYTLSKMQELIEQSGMQFILSMDADTHKEVCEDSERIYVIAREQGKEMN